MDGSQAFKREDSPINVTVGQAPLDLSRMLYMMYQHLDHQVAIADTKANIVIAANAILITGFSISLPAISDLVGNFETIDTIGMAALLSMLLTLLVNLGSILYAIVSARPNLIRPHHEPNMFFFGDLAAVDVNELEAMFFERNVNRVKRDVLQQIQARSKVVLQKFKRVRLSMNLLLLAAVSWVITQILLVL